MNKFFAIVFAVLAVLAFYGAAFQGARWHFATCFACAFISLLLFADSSDPQKPSLSGK
jgi:hypothetical protein